MGKNYTDKQENNYTISYIDNSRDNQTNNSNDNEAIIKKRIIRLTNRQIIIPLNKHLYKGIILLIIPQLRNSIALQSCIRSKEKHMKLWRK